MGVWMWYSVISTKEVLFNLFPATSPVCTEGFGSALVLSCVLVSCLCGGLIETLITLINGSLASFLREGWKEVKKSEISFTESDYCILPALKALCIPLYRVYVLSLKQLFRLDMVMRQFCHAGIHVSFPGLKRRAKWPVKMIHLQLWCKSQLCLWTQE